MDDFKIKKDRMLRKTSPDASNLIYGKVQPQATDLEEAILGAIMLEKNALTAVIEKLQPSFFYVEAHQLIYQAVKVLFEKSAPVDILTVVEQLRHAGELEMVGGAYYITKLTNMVVSSANIETYANIVVQKFVQRELIRVSNTIINEAFEDTTDVFDLMDTAEQNLYDITDKHLRKNFKSIDSLISNTLLQIEELKNKKEKYTGVPSGFLELDRITSGWQKKDLIILAARPSVGKTAFALNLIRNSALHPDKQFPVAFFSLEMSAEQIVKRFIATETEINISKIMHGDLMDYEMVQLNNRISHLIEAPIFIDDTPGLNIFELRAKCRRLKQKNNIGLIVIDYLQLMTSKSDNRNMNREQEISRISRDLKALAKEIDVPIIALSQLSRDVEKRKGESKMPILSDIRDSGSIEQDADMVLFLYRPEYHQQNTDAQGESTEGQTFLNIAKNRNGSLANIELYMNKSIGKFVEANFANKPSNISGAGNSNPGNNRIAKPDGSGFYLQLPSKGNSLPNSNNNPDNDDDAPF